MSLDVEPGRITSLIGPNGAGKTTFFNCLTGELEPDSGEVVFDGVDITRYETHRRAKLGIARTFQRLEVFTGMTVYENVQVAAEAVRPGATFRGVFRLRHTPEADVVEEVETILERIGLADVAGEMAGDLPTGTLRLVELARAVATRPRALLADELASGLDVTESHQLAGVLRELAASGLAILLIEHDIELVMELSSVIYVVDFGKLIASGPPDAIASDPAVQAAYLGVDAAAVKKEGRRGATARR